MSIEDYPNLAFRKTRDDRFEGKVEQGRNTFAVKVEVNGKPHYGLLLHQTVVVWYDPELRVASLHTGGYKTHTTKERINWALPPGWHLYQRHGEWYVSLPTNEEFDFKDGMMLDFEDRCLVPEYLVPKIQIGKAI